MPLVEAGVVDADGSEDETHSSCSRSSLSATCMSDDDDDCSTIEDECAPDYLDDPAFFDLDDQVAEIDGLPPLEEVDAQLVNTSATGAAPSTASSTHASANAKTASGSRGFHAVLRRGLSRAFVANPQLLPHHYVINSGAGDSRPLALPVDSVQRRQAGHFLCRAVATLTRPSGPSCSVFRDAVGLLDSSPARVGVPFAGC